MDYFAYLLGIGIGFALGVYWSQKYYNKLLEQHYKEYHGESE